MDIAKAVKDVKAGKIDFKVDKFGIIHAAVGKASFDAKMIEDNANELIQAIVADRLPPKDPYVGWSKNLCVAVSAIQHHQMMSKLFSN